MLGCVSMFLVIRLLWGLLSPETFSYQVPVGFAVTASTSFATGYFKPSVPKSKTRRTNRQRSSRSRYRRFRRRHLHYCLVRRCYSRAYAASPWSVRTRQHRRWRRRKQRQRVRYRVKRQQLKWKKFLTPQLSSRTLWNHHRKVNSDFLSADSDSFAPFATYGLIPEEVLSKFCEERAHTFMSTTRLMKSFDNMSLLDGAKQTAKRLSLFRSESEATRKRSTFKSCPLVWDTGASFGLTPFRGDFIDYTECSIPVNDIARTNMVVGIGTTLHKFLVDGNELFLPCLSYHLPTADVRLFSPQTYHTIYGGHSVVNGDMAQMYIDFLKVEVEIDREGSNVPMVHGCSVSPKEMEEHGPHIRSALPQFKRKVDALSSWNEGAFSWNLATTEIDDEFAHYGSAFGYGLPGVGVPENNNLSSAQKELLLWHWKLGISMQRIQELMRVVEISEENGATSTMDRVIIPKIKATATCPIPMCQSCQLSRAKQRKPKTTKSKAIPEASGAITRQKYNVGDFVSLDQYVVKTPGRLPTGFGRESITNMFHGGTIF